MRGVAPAVSRTTAGNPVQECVGAVQGVRKVAELKPMLASYWYQPVTKTGKTVGDTVGATVGLAVGALGAIVGNLVGTLACR